MEKNIVAAYSHLGRAEEAFHELLTVIARESISFFHKRRPYGNETADTPADHPFNSFSAKSFGGDRSARLFGMSTLRFPDIGTLCTAASGYGTNAYMHSGEITHSFDSLGINKRETVQMEYYLKEGSVIMSVKARGSQAQQVMDILKRHEPVHLSEETS